MEEASGQEVNNSVSAPVAKSEDLDALFEQKSSKLVWVLPSVLLHIVVVAVWVMFPGEKEDPQARKLTVRSEQAQQLKEFVEEANVLELRAELSELQTIKATMDKLRQDKIAELRKFEGDMHTELPDDIRKILGNMLQTSDQLTVDQSLIQTGLDQVAAGEGQYIPLLEANRLKDAAPLMLGVAELWRPIHDVRNNASTKLEHLSQYLIQVNDLLQWVAAPDVLATWQVVQETGKAVTSQQNVWSGEVWKYYDNYQKELNDLARNGGAHQDFLTDLDTREKDETAKATAQKAEHEKALAESIAAEEAAKVELTRLQAEAKKAQEAFDTEKKAIAALPNKTADEKKTREERAAGLKPLEQAIQATKKALFEQQGVVKKAGQTHAEADKRLKNLKPWKKGRDEENKLEYINKLCSKMKTTRLTVQKPETVLASVVAFRAAIAQFEQTLNQLPKKEKAP